MRLEIHARDLPGRTCGGLDPDVEPRDIHVGIQVGREPAQVVAGDVAQATFVADLKVVPLGDGVDFRGPAVQGRRGERFVYLTWGDVGPDGTFEMFRRAKLMLGVIDPAVIAAADQPGHMLRADLGLTDAKGNPLCAVVLPPTIVWQAVEPAA